MSDYVEYVCYNISVPVVMHVHSYIYHNLIYVENILQVNLMAIHCISQFE